jgi:glycosyltransferase involved in cell wall biosynthesis
MKIAFVSQPWTNAGPPNDADSIGILTYQLARRLARSHQIIIYGKKIPSPKESRNPCNEIRYIGISSNFVDLLFRPRNILYDMRMLNSKCPWFASKLFHLGYILKLARSLKNQNCSIVHIQNFSQFVPIIRAFNPDAKIVLHMHCDWLAQLDRTLIENRIRKVDLIIGCSDYITNNIRNRFPDFADRCCNVYNGVDIDIFSKNNTASKFEPNKNIKKLLYVGRLSPEKGVHILLDAFEKVLSRFPQTELKIIGPEVVVAREMIGSSYDGASISDLAPFYSGSYRLKLQEKLSSNALKCVSFAGLVQHSDLHEHYQNSDLFILPSICHEAFGMPLIEAMAMEVPVIASRGGAFPEIVEAGKTGMLVERGDADDLAEAIILLLSDDNLRKSMGKAGQQRVLGKFSWENAANNLLSHYRKICSAL